MGLRDNFKKGTVELMVLALLSESDMYGYQISQLILERSKGKIKVPEGSLYPTLYRMVDNGYITENKVLVGRRMTRVYYHLEPGGHERFEEMLWEYSEFADGLTSILSFCTPVEEDDT